MSHLKSMIFIVSVLFTASCAKESGSTTETSKDTSMPEVSEMMQEEVMVADVDPAALSALSKGESYTLKINDTLSFELLVGSRNEYVKGITSISATITGERKGIAVLSIQADTVAGSFQVPGEEWVYMLGYNRESARHELRKIKPDVMTVDDVLNPDSSMN